MKDFSKMSPALRCYHRKAAAFRAQGLTSLGAARVRVVRSGKRVSPEEKLMLQRERGLRAWNKRVRRMRDLNLTTRGTQRIYRVNRADALLLKSEIDGLAASLAMVWADLPASVQVRVLALESSLAGVRRQL